MELTNEEALLRNAVFDEDKKARAIVLKILDAGLKAIDPRKAVRNHVRRVNDILHINNFTFDLNDFQRVFVVGGGNASGAMAEALEEILADSLTGGFVNVPRRTKSDFKTHKLFLIGAGHPIPDDNGMNGAKKIIQLISKTNEKDLVICLISGGGSALVPLPAAHIRLRDKKALTTALLKCGATINEINAVRKHISGLKGGQFAKLAYPATIVSLILSDVVGDPLDTIASGPTMPDMTTFNDAISILKKHNVWKNNTPKSIKRRLEAGARGKVPETPKPEDKAFDNTYNFLIGNNRVAALAACREGEKLGLKTLLLSTTIQGEARYVGSAYAEIMKGILVYGSPVAKPAVVVACGETTVTVMGRGKGGRNQELVLSASLNIEHLRGVAIASIGTDGIDGPTNAAGAIADGQTTMRAYGKNLDPNDFLMNNNSYNFFSKLCDLIFTGPTGTSVNDIAVMVVT